MRLRKVVSNVLLAAAMVLAFAGITAAQETTTGSIRVGCSTHRV